MIAKEEIDAKSSELGVHTSNVQRDYVFSWLLYGLFTEQAPLRNDLILKGGNAIRKGYFENARYSGDIDLSAQASIGEESLQNALVMACEIASENSGIEFIVDDTRIRSRGVDGDSGNLFEARVYFRSFYGEEDFVLKVDLDLKEFDRIFLPVQTRSLIHSYSDFELCKASLSCMKLEEMLASKLKALLQRQHSPDLYDLIYSIFFQNHIAINRLEIISTFLRKTIYESNPGAAKDLLLGLPLSLVRRFWSQYLVCPKISEISFDQAQANFSSLIPDLFNLLGTPAFAPAVAGGVPFDHFGSPVRQSIQEAGQLQKLLSMVYDGMERIVEPYALTYKTRKEGEGAEYFYAWDRSGGRSGKTGIKSFFASKVQRAEVLDESFDPRFPIELSKTSGYFSSGDFSAQSTRFSGFGGARARKRSRSSWGSPIFETTYQMECPYCGKRFKRKTMDTKLNKHKDKYGNQCYGRVGYIV